MLDGHQLYAAAPRTSLNFRFARVPAEFRLHFKPQLFLNKTNLFPKFIFVNLLKFVEEAMSHPSCVLRGDLFPFILVFKFKSTGVHYRYISEA